MTQDSSATMWDPRSYIHSLMVYWFLPIAQVIELRALGVSRPNYLRCHVEGGYFNDPIALAKAAAELTQFSTGVYFTPNPVASALLARASNRIVQNPVNLTADSNVDCRKWLLIDLDAVRPAGISSTDSEHNAAIIRAHEVREWLRGHGFPEPLLASSGNGAHLMYRIELPADDGGLVLRCLSALAFHFNTDTVCIDTAVHNPARIWRVYGTVARKGDDTQDRPHRLAQVLSFPESLTVVATERLEWLAQQAPTPPRHPRQFRGVQFDLEGWIRQHNLTVEGPQDWQGGRKWVFPVCPWDESHTNRAAFIVQLPNGAIGAGCRHNGCSDHDWQALRDLYEPDRQRTAGDIDLPDDTPIAIRRAHRRGRRTSR